MERATLAGRSERRGRRGAWLCTRPDTVQPPPSVGVKRELEGRRPRGRGSTPPGRPRSLVIDEVALEVHQPGPDEACAAGRRPGRARRRRWPSNCAPRRRRRTSTESRGVATPAPPTATGVSSSVVAGARGRARRPPSTTADLPVDEVDGRRGRAPGPARRTARTGRPPSQTMALDLPVDRHAGELAAVAEARARTRASAAWAPSRGSSTAPSRCTAVTVPGARSPRRRRRSAVAVAGPLASRPAAVRRADTTWSPAAADRVERGRR